MIKTPEELLEYISDHLLYVSLSFKNGLTVEEVRCLRDEIKTCLFDAEKKRRMGIKKLGD